MGETRADGGEALAARLHATGLQVASWLRATSIHLACSSVISPDTSR